ncbi:hypothetical protein DFA_10419 [Cavenderia fasciculata]|uniref:Uncharacterized protein n=1 Tax=Cavenderia fasciculata TaxID=261658 RepID=F4QA58_CACFS|nr:uncharacterized protein DFA_10419 [Cavenderia fasciculata]EGG15577.1 hypothetical protein DFA_10419 [Cavenderia fasciculata]|eukprot:XP_004354319.1 hypothetical protein DFA_10419 [Cavenderia fasciculata]
MPPVTLTSDVTAPPYTLSDCTDQEKLSNLTEPTHPIFNLCLPKCINALKYYRSLKEDPINQVK